MQANLIDSCRNRRTPYTDRVEALGVTGYSIVNHTLLPKSFGRSIEEDYWHLKKHVQLWDVSCQKQVEIRGPDAARLAQLMTPRNLSEMKVGQCFYAPVIDDSAGLLNDPVIIKRASDWFWFSIADSDMLLWAKGLAVGMNLNVVVGEPDISPLAVQGPKAEDLVAAVFGASARSIRHFEFVEMELYNRSLVVARTGYSKQDGFEIYLDQTQMGPLLWDTLWEAGSSFEIIAGCPNLIERVESGLLSYGNEMSRENNPLEINFDRLCDLGGTLDYIGRASLEEIARSGPEQRIRGIMFDGLPCQPCRSPWPLTLDGHLIGRITTATWSPRFKKNIAIGMLKKDTWDVGQEVVVRLEGGNRYSGLVTTLPFDETNA